MAREPNALELIVQQVESVAPELSARRLTEIAIDIGRELGGRRYYIPMGRPESRRGDAAQAPATSGRPSE